MPLCRHPARPLEKPLPFAGSGFSSADLFKDYWINFLPFFTTIPRNPLLTC